MLGNLVISSDIKNAIRTNQIQKYILNNTNNNFTSYKEGDLTPSYIFPNGGVKNNYKINGYTYNPFIENLPVDYYNAYGTNFKIDMPLYNREDDRLPDLISIGLNNPTKNARSIGTAIY